MKTSIITTIIALFMINVLSAQVKIGNNPQLLDPASLLELESTSRVLVITRVSNAQMNTINPLVGALVYNTDEECIHYYNGLTWVNICDELDNSFTVSTRADYLGALNPNARDSTVVITTTTNLDDSVNYNFEVGQITGANIIDQSINGDSKLQTSSVTTRVLAPKSVTIGKLADATGNPGDILQWNGSQWTLVNESTLGITEKDSIVGNEVVGPTDATLFLSGAGSEFDPLTLDVSPLGIDTAELADDAVTSIKISNANVTNEKLDKSNIPLSGFGDPLTNVSMGNQNIINVADPGNPQDAVNLQTLNAAITASEGLDDDTDDTNELQDLNLATNILTLSNPGTPGNQVDLGVYLDDTNTTNATFTQDGTNLILTDSENNTVTIPLADIQDADTNTTNTSLTQDGTDLILTDSENNTVTIPLADIQDGDTTYSTGIGLSQTGTQFAVTNPVIAIGRIIGGTDTSTGATVTNNTNGSYTVNLSSTPSNFVVQLTTLNNVGARTIQITSQGADQFDVQVYDATGAFSDSDWNFTVISF